MDDRKDQEERIRERAYAIWHAAGLPEGRHDEHWAQAERELRDERGSDAAPSAATEPAVAAAPAPGVTTASDQAKTSVVPPAETKAALRGTRSSDRLTAS